MTNNDARRDIPVSPLAAHLSETYFAMADKAADEAYFASDFDKDKLADHYWQMGVRCVNRQDFPSADHWRGF